MRVVTMACAALVFAAGSTFGVDYTFVGTTFPATWETTTNWDDGSGGPLVLPSTSADRFYVGGNLSTTSRVNLPTPGATVTRTYGSIVVDNGQIGVGNGIYRFASGDGQNGDFILTGKTARLTYQTWGVACTFDLDGDFIFDPPGSMSMSWEGYNETVRMRGANATFKVEAATGNTNAIDKVIVDNGARVNFATNWNGGSGNNMKALDLWGAASGAVYVPYKTTEQVKLLGAASSASQLDVILYPNTSSWPIVGGRRVGDGKFIQGAYHDVDFGAVNWIGTNDCGTYTARLPGDLATRNLRIGYLVASDPPAPNGGIQFTLDTDNHALTVNGDLTLGPAAGYVARNYGASLTANHSLVKIGGNVNVKYTNTQGAYILGGTSTLRVGGNWLIDCATLSGVNWDMGAGTVICDGNGTGKAQTITSKGLPFCNFEINNPGGTVTLAGNLVLKGDFDLTAGTLAVGANYLVFHGGIDNEDLAQTIDVDTGAALSRVYIQAGSSTFVKLMSDLTISDNLDIDAGCKLFLNGFTLNAEGQTITETTPWDQGEIVGGAAIPEPATLLLIGTGALGVLGCVRRRRMS